MTTATTAKARPWTAKRGRWHEVPPGRYTPAEVAALTGLCVESVRSMFRKGRTPPPGFRRIERDGRSFDIIRE